MHTKAPTPAMAGMGRKQTLAANVANGFETAVSALIVFQILEAARAPFLGCIGGDCFDLCLLRLGLSPCLLS
jgi:hypothetical protein